MKATIKAVRHSKMALSGTLLETIAVVALHNGGILDTVAAPATGRYNPPDADGVRYVERPDRCGLRFVGHADELARIRHTGWYSDNADSGDTMRGGVWQLPARNGCAQYVAGYASSYGSEGVTVDLSTVWAGERGGNDRDTDEDTLRDVARTADRLAELAAEHEREYQAASSAGIAYAEAGDELRAIRRSVRDPLDDIRAATLSPPICAVLSVHVRRLLADMQALRLKRAALAAGDYMDDALPGWHGSASLAVFRENAGIR